MRPTVHYTHEFGGCQRDIEVALATILLTEDEYRAEFKPDSCAVEAVA